MIFLEDARPAGHVNETQVVACRPWRPIVAGHVDLFSRAHIKVNNVSSLIPHTTGMLPKVAHASYVVILLIEFLQ